MQKLKGLRRCHPRTAKHPLAQQGLRFQSQYLGHESGLHDNRLRYYDPGHPIGDFARKKK